MGTPTRPAVIVDPGRQFGTPRIDGTRVPALRAAEARWSGLTVAQVAAQLGLNRQQVIVACWHTARWHQTDQQRQKWRRRWKAWADEATPLLERELYHQVPDPPCATEA